MPASGPRRSGSALGGGPCRGPLIDDDLLRLGAGEELPLDQRRLVELERVAGEPGLDLLRVAILGRVGARVAAMAVGHAFDEGRAATGTGAVRRLGGGFVDRLDVVAVDLHRRHLVALGPLDQVLVGRRVVDAGELAVEVVLADEQDRQLPDLGDIHRLVEGADIGRAVAEEGRRELAAAIELGRDAGADRNRQAAADDAEGADQALVDVGEVHRAADAAADTRCAAEQLGERRLGIHAAGDADAVAAIGVADIVILAEHDAGARRDRLLSLAEVGGAVDEALEVASLHLLLELADTDHHAEQVEPVLVGERLDLGDGLRRLWRFRLHAGFHWLGRLSDRAARRDAWQ